ncbi:12914_t:CDS:2, partial [Dentiscutata erythropus]
DSKEVDIDIEIDGTRFAIMCKDWTRDIGPSVIQTFDGILTQLKSGTVGVVVTPDEGNFSFNCIKRAKNSIHHIILTKKSYICRDLKIGKQSFEQLKKYVETICL